MLVAILFEKIKTQIMIDEIFKLLQEYPKAGATSIAIVSGSAGWLLRNVFQLIIENYRYSKELKTFFWKEKINAAKKASEFYLENLNFLNLVRIQFELCESGKIEHQQLIENFEKEVNFYREKLKSFPHFEHHHINIFYDFDESKIMSITDNSIEIQQKIQELISDQSTPSEEFNQKIKDSLKTLKDNYFELFKIYKGYVKKVREDIGNYI